MKKTTQELLRFALQRLDYKSKPIVFWDYTILYNYSASIIKKYWREIGVVVEGYIYINSPFERFLFSRAVEKNLWEITVFSSNHIREIVDTKTEAMSEIINLKKKISELEEKLAQSVANNIDLSPNSELDD